MSYTGGFIVRYARVNPVVITNAGHELLTEP